MLINFHSVYKTRITYTRVTPSCRSRSPTSDALEYDNEQHWGRTAVLDGHIHLEDVLTVTEKVVLPLGKDK